MLRNPLKFSLPFGISSKRLIKTETRKDSNLRQYSGSSTEKIPTMKQLKELLTREMGIDSGYSVKPKDRSDLLKFLPKTQEELPARSMQDSYVAGIIPLSTDKELQDKYVTFLGFVRVGRLLEDMDLFAVLVAFKHILNPNVPEGTPFPYSLVTALVDRIQFTDFTPKANEDIKLSGHVSWAGKSSMEVVVWIEQKSNDVWNRITRALFVMAARDPTNTKAGIINPMQPANERETKIFAGGEFRKQERIKIQKQHVLRVIPNSEEQKIIYNLYMKTTNDTIGLRHRVLPSGSVWMSNHTISSVVFSHPEDRNRNNTVFGGFIMRQAVELSWILGYMYSKHRPKLKNISDIHFQNPIAVGSLIQMHSHVVYNHENLMQITSYAEVYNPNTGDSKTTNIFHITLQAPEEVKECIPLTYHEAMMYIDGRRHLLKLLNSTMLNQE